MAFKNYLFQGSYTNIQSFSYGKNTVITAILHVYKDETKKEQLCTRTINIFPQEVPRLDGAFLTEPPAEVSVGMGFLTAPTGCRGIWEGRDQMYAVWNGSDWVFWFLGGRTLYYDVQNHKYLRLLNDYSLAPTECFEDFRVWQQWFNFSDSSMNVIKNIYQCLKEGPSFAACIDA